MNKKILLFILSAAFCFLPFLVHKDVMAADDYIFEEKTYYFDIEYSGDGAYMKQSFSFKTACVPVVSKESNNTYYLRLIDTDYSIKAFSTSLATLVNVPGYDYSWINFGKSSLSDDYSVWSYRVFNGNLMSSTYTITSSNVAIFNSSMASLNGSDILSLTVYPDKGPYGYYYQGNFYTETEPEYNASIYELQMQFAYCRTWHDDDLNTQWQEVRAGFYLDDENLNSAYSNLTYYSLELWADVPTGGDKYFIDSRTFSTWSTSGNMYIYTDTTLDLWPTVNGKPSDFFLDKDITWYFRLVYDDNNNIRFTSNYWTFEGEMNTSEAMDGERSGGYLNVYNNNLDTGSSGTGGTISSGQSANGYSQYTAGSSTTDYNFGTFNVTDFINSSTFVNLTAAFQQIYFFFPPWVWGLMLFGLSAILAIALLKNLL